MSNKHLEPVSTSLSQIVKGIENGIYCIPKFQRKFVWSSTAIESLGDSLLRGYPVSSILTMPTNGNLKIAAKPLNLLDQDLVFEDKNLDGKYVLDGQQRLTSSGRIYCDLDERNQYFYDMLAMLLDQYPNDHLECTNVFINKVSKIKDSLCYSFQRGRGGVVPHKQNFRFISCKKVIDGQSATIVNKFIGEFEGLSLEKEEKYTNYLNQQFGQLGSYALQEQRLDPCAELGLVCRVFEKVNSTGKKLTAFDLINAKSFETNIEKYKSGLSDYISTILQSQEHLDNDAYQATCVLFESATQKDGDSEYENLGRLVRILFLTELLEKNKTPAISNNLMLMKDANFWFKSFDENIKAILDVSKKLYRQGIMRFIPLAYIEYMIAIACSDKRIINEDIFFETVRDYGLKLSLDSKSFSKSDLDVVQDFKCYANDLILTNGFEKYTLKSKPSTSLIITENMIDKSKVKGNNVFQVIYYIMTKLNHEGKFSQDISGKHLTSLEKYDQHHVFPKATTKKMSDGIFNTICNIIPLNSKTNRDEIKDMPFEEYRDKLINIHGEDKVKRLFENNLLEFKLGAINYEEYLLDRQRKIMNYLDSYFNGNKSKES